MKKIKLINQKDFFREIKYAYQRIRYGFDERIYWEFDSYFAQFIPPLKKFCQDEHDPLDIHNPKRNEVYKTTLDLIRAWENQSYEEMWDGKKTVELWEYFGKNINWYWN